MLYQMMDCPQEDLLAADPNDLDDDWGPENNDCWNSPTDFDEYEMNPEDCYDPYDMEYDHA